MLWHSPWCFVHSVTRWCQHLHFTVHETLNTKLVCQVRQRFSIHSGLPVQSLPHQSQSSRTCSTSHDDEDDAADDDSSWENIKCQWQCQVCIAWLEGWAKGLMSAADCQAGLHCSGSNVCTEPLPLGSSCSQNGKELVISLLSWITCRTGPKARMF